MSSAKFQARLRFQGGELEIDAGTRPSNLVQQIGFWSAACLTALCALELVLQGVMFATLTNGAIENNTAYYFTQTAAFFTAPLFVVLMACLFFVAADESKIFALISFGFAICYAVLGGINYYVQVTAVRLAALNGGLDLVAPFLMPNLSVMFAFDILGYFFLTLSMLAAVPLFRGKGIERRLRWVLVVNFIIGIAAVLGNLIGDPMLLLPILPLTWIAAGVATGLLAIWFHQQDVQAGELRA